LFPFYLFFTDIKSEIIIKAATPIPIKELVFNPEVLGGGI
tara:strand:- start:12 stop:131 length:120 start_codon:yes stop_codon:yes gene_type:complete